MTTTKNFFFAIGIGFLVFLSNVATSAVSIPPFKPNIVDITGTLSTEEQAEINEALQTVRELANIWGAVFVINSLDDDSIESVAERAFRQWELGQRGIDNGLLLVLSMKDRQSRFEVGYGLEGDIPDVVALRALDEVLKPLMRGEQYKEAIIASFFYLASVKSDNPAFHGFRDSTTTRAANDHDINFLFGSLALAVYLFALWVVPFLKHKQVLAQARRLEETIAGFKIADHADLEANKSIGIKIFLSINPGCFVFVISALNLIAMTLITAFIILFATGYVRNSGRKYRSTEAFEAFLDSERKRRKPLLDAGHMEELSPGRFKFTDSYYASPEYIAAKAHSRSPSSSSSSSSRSSSSGGGRSGGGGASSRW